MVLLPILQENIFNMNREANHRPNAFQVKYYEIVLLSCSTTQYFNVGKKIETSIQMQFNLAWYDIQSPSGDFKFGHICWIYITSNSISFGPDKNIDQLSERKWVIKSILYERFRTESHRKWSRKWLLRVVGNSFIFKTYSLCSNVN